MFGKNTPLHRTWCRIHMASPSASVAETRASMDEENGKWTAPSQVLFCHTPSDFGSRKT
jgi:hypothetical protein